MKRLIQGLVVFCLIIWSIGIWYFSEYLAEGPLGRDSNVVIAKGSGLTEISSNLFSRGIIKSQPVFIIAAHLTGKASKLLAGEYHIKAQASPYEILKLVTSGDVVIRKITIPEGLTSAEIVKRLNQLKGLAGFIKKKPPEGSLLPETYNYTYGQSRGDIIERMQKGMINVLTTAWGQRDKNSPIKSMNEALILASIIEKETGLENERPLISSVFINRLATKMRLQSDPTVLYGLPVGGQRQRLTRHDLNRKTPHNTYKIKGLPATPICNPGKASIVAALNPSKSDFFYFVATGTGGHSFSRNLEEHNKNVAKWRKFQRSKLQ